MPSVNNVHVKSNTGALTYTVPGISNPTTTTPVVLPTGQPTTTIVNNSAVPLVIPHDIYGFVPGTIAASEILFQIIFTTTVTFPVGFVNSLAVCMVAPTFDVILTVMLNGVNVGYVTFLAASTTATFSLPSAIVTSPGDILLMFAPLSVDQTFAGVVYTFAGTVS